MRFRQSADSLLSAPAEPPDSYTSAVEDNGGLNMTLRGLSSNGCRQIGPCADGSTNRTRLLTLVTHVTTTLLLFLSVALVYIRVGV